VSKLHSQSRASLCGDVSISFSDVTPVLIILSLKDSHLSAADMLHSSVGEFEGGGVGGMDSDGLIVGMTEEEGLELGIIETEGPSVGLGDAVGKELGAYEILGASLGIRE